MVCLDTSFLIDVIKGKENVKDLEKELIKRGVILTIASPSIVELFRGLYLKANLKYINENEIKKINEIISSFIILSLDKTSAVLAGEIEANLINKGEKIDVEDTMIGAICISNNEKLVTKNKKHFGKIEELKIEPY